MNTALTNNQSYSNVSSLNQQFNTMMKRFNSSKTALERVVDQLTSSEREQLIKQLQLEATTIQSTFTTHVLHQPSFKHFDLFVTVMWHLASQLKALLDTERNGMSLFHDATAVAEKQAIVGFFVFVKTLNVMLPVELHSLGLTAALTNKNYEQFVTLVD